MTYFCLSLGLFVEVLAAGAALQVAENGETLKRLNNVFKQALNCRVRDKKTFWTIKFDDER